MYHCRFCEPDSLDRTLVNGSIVLCDGLSNAESLGATGAILRDDVYNDTAFAFPLPASYLGLVDGAQVYDYINKSRSSFIVLPYIFKILLVYISFLFTHIFFLPITHAATPQQPSSRVLRSIKHRLHLLCPFLQGVQIPSLGTF